MKSRFGFTVVEIVIALVIIAIGFLPIYNLFRQGSVGTVNTINETIATNYASDLVNFCKDLNQTQIYDKDNRKEIEFENDNEIITFFQDKLGLTAPSEVQAPFIRKMKLKRFHDYFDRGLFSGLLELFKDIINGRKFVPAYVVEVTVTFPRNNARTDNADRDDVTLYTLIMD